MPICSSFHFGPAGMGFCTWWWQTFELQWMVRRGNMQEALRRSSERVSQQSLGFKLMWTHTWTRVYPSIYSEVCGPRSRGSVSSCTGVVHKDDDPVPRVMVLALIRIAGTQRLWQASVSFIKSTSLVWILWVETPWSFRRSGLCIHFRGLWFRLGSGLSYWA